MSSEDKENIIQSAPPELGLFHQDVVDPEQELYLYWAHGLSPQQIRNRCIRSLRANRILHEPDWINKAEALEEISEELLSEVY